MTTQDANAPKKVNVDGQTVEMHPLDEQIELDKYTKANTANGTGKMPFRILRMKPGGSLQ